MTRRRGRFSRVGWLRRSRPLPSFHRWGGDLQDVIIRLRTSRIRNHVTAVVFLILRLGSMKLE
uniref:Uncharacterized protein n=1 Tax=Musa acuminata subsp. malaccensis TaxID=214687 RepID=A0A804JJX9_MUSAM